MRSTIAALTILALSASSSFGQDLPLSAPEFNSGEGLEYFNEEEELEEEALPSPPTAEELLADLAIVENEEDASDLEQRLYLLWSRSGSATADLLLSRSEEAIDEDEFDTADLLLSELTELAPLFAEGWHQHAIISMRRENFEEAMTSLRHTLALQPKHYIAMAELGSILEEFGDSESALAAYREALAINPFIEGLQERVSELTRSVEGQGI